MDSREEIDLLYVLLLGIIGMFLMSFVVIAFFLFYRKRLNTEEEKKNELEINHQKELLRASFASQEEVQHRIAKNLHDDVGGLLAVSKIYIGQFLESDLPKPILEKAIQLNNIQQEILDSIRGISKELSPVVLQKLGLFSAIENMGIQLTIENEFVVSIFGELNNSVISKQNQLEIYRVVQELLNNTIKHANATKVFIELIEKKTELKLIYSDNGKGFDYSNKIQNPNGLGLLNMESRITLLNGEMDYKNVISGIQVEITVPLLISDVYD